jgi:hypothetical protein
VEIPPSKDNRVMLSTARDVHGVPFPVVEYSKSARTEESLDVLHERIESYFGGAASFCFDVQRYKNVTSDSSHHLGGARMGVDPETSVVDDTLRVHDVDNLYIVGGAVFPNCGLANPTYTIVALAIRLAETLTSNDHLLSRNILTSDKAKKIAIIGSGRRVVEDVLPAIEANLDLYKLTAIYARTKKKLFGINKTYVVEPTFSQMDIEGLDYLYIAVTPSDISDVFNQLSSFNLKHLTIIIDTPTPDLEHYKDFFKKIIVAEDSVYIPWLSLISTGTEVLAEKALYAYHGIALLKAIQKSQVQMGYNFLSKTWFKFKNGARCVIKGQRDYQSGTLLFREKNDSGPTSVELVLEGEYCKGFAFKDRKVLLDSVESLLMGGCCREDTIVTKMLSIKRVGLYRMLKNIEEDKNIWSYDEGRNDITMQTILNKYRIYFKI